jgi:hypothetical protein
MGQQFFAKARTLSRSDILDLVRAALVLAMTVGMALVVPPRVLGAVDESAGQPRFEVTQ